jgi:hypothetical protein
VTTEPVWITGVGLVSCLGEGAEAHLSALEAPEGSRPPVVDEEGFAPFPCIRCRPWSWTGRSRSAATSGRWSPGSGSAPTPRGWLSTTPARAAWFPTCTSSSRRAAASATRRWTRPSCPNSPRCRPSGPGRC